MACCEHGKMTMTIDGQVYSARGEFTLSPTNFEREGGLNEDGTIWSSKNPVPATAEGSLDHCTADPSIWEKCDATVTFQLESGVSYTYPNARITGKPEINTRTGEMSGFSLIAPFSRRVA